MKLITEEDGLTFDLNLPKARPRLNSEFEALPALSTASSSSQQAAAAAVKPVTTVAEV
jgi:hypothetical protein